MWRKVIRRNPKLLATRRTSTTRRLARWAPGERQDLIRDGVSDKHNAE